jgi:hypothetical protein
MVTGDEPADVRVRALVVAVLTATLPKLRPVALTVNCGFAATPVPLKATAAVLPLAELLLMVSCPVAAPAAVGRNFTCKVTDWFGLSVTGKLPATRLKPVPAIEAEFTVTAAVPDDVSVSESVAEEFTLTLPKLRVAALVVNCGLVAAVPVPLKAADPGLVAELLVIVSFPVAAPAAVGRNFSCKVTDWFGLSVTGELPETMVKPAPLMVADSSFTARVPVDVSVTEPVAGELTVTLPKLRVETLSFRVRASLCFTVAPADVTNARQQASARRRTLPRPLSLEISVEGLELRPICCGDWGVESHVEADTT